MKRLSLLILPLCAFAPLGEATECSPTGFQDQYSNMVEAYEKANKEANTQRKATFISDAGLKLNATSKEQVGKVDIEFGSGTNIYRVGLSGAVDDENNGVIFDKDGIQSTGGKLNFGYTKLILQTDTTEQFLERVKQFDAKVFPACTKRKSCEEQAEAAGREVATACKAEIEAHQKSLQQDIPPFIDEYYFVSIDGSYGKNDFKHFDLDSNDFVKQNEEAYEVGVSAGKVYTKSKQVVKVGLTYKDQYAFSSSNPEREICRTLPENAAFSECFDTRLAPPEESTSLSVLATYSKFLDKDKLIKGFSVEASYDWDEEQYSVNVPIYFYREKNDEFHAGLSLGYLNGFNDEVDGFGIGIFFTNSFSLHKL